MKRLTTDEITKEKGMYKLAHNSCYVGENGAARYRDFDKDVEVRDYIRKLMLKYGTWEEADAEMTDDDSFDESMIDLLFYGEESIEGIIALLYLHMWSKADLHGRLKEYEDTELTSEQMEQIDKDFSEQAKELAELKKQLPPCKVGDTIYVVPSKVNHDLNVLNKHYGDNRVYEQVVSEIRIYRSGMFIVTCDGQAGVREESYKEIWFFNKEEAEAKLKEMEGE